MEKICFKRDLLYDALKKLKKVVPKRHSNPVCKFLLFEFHYAGKEDEDSLSEFTISATDEDVFTQLKYISGLSYKTDGVPKLFLLPFKELYGILKKMDKDEKELTLVFPDNFDPASGDDSSVTVVTEFAEFKLFVLGVDPGNTFPTRPEFHSVFSDKMDLPEISNEELGYGLSFGGTFLKRKSGKFTTDCINLSCDDGEVSFTSTNEKSIVMASCVNKGDDEEINFLLGKTAKKFAEELLKDDEDSDYYSVYLTSDDDGLYLNVKNGYIFQKSRKGVFPNVISIFSHCTDSDVYKISLHRKDTLKSLEQVLSVVGKSDSPSYFVATPDSVHVRDNNLFMGESKVHLDFLSSTVDTEVEVPFSCQCLRDLFKNSDEEVMTIYLKDSQSPLRYESLGGSYKAIVST